MDEFVVSGSDDGNWFMWEKDTGKLHDILEGDGTVVNVIEGHPYLPLVAVSGIDTTVKVRFFLTIHQAGDSLTNVDFSSFSHLRQARADSPDSIKPTR